MKKVFKSLDYGEAPLTDNIKHEQCSLDKIQVTAQVQRYVYGKKIDFFS